MDTALNDRKINASQGDEHLMRMPDGGIAEMGAGKELPFDKAFQEISELRDNRRSARA